VWWRQRFSSCERQISQIRPRLTPFCSVPSTLVLDKMQMKENGDSLIQFGWILMALDQIRVTVMTKEILKLWAVYWVLLHTLVTPISDSPLSLLYSISNRKPKKPCHSVYLWKLNVWCLFLVSSETIPYLWRLIGYRYIH